MARPRNDKLKEQIVRESWRQFRTHGYSGTTYRTIADACGISRNLVQYHFPKKELLSTAFMECVLEQAQQALGLSPEAIRNNYRAIYEVGCCFFAFLLQKEGYRSFLLDVIASRERTENVLAFNVSWALARIDVPKGIDIEPVRQEVVVSMGGFYELLYYCLKEQKPFAVLPRLACVVERFQAAIAQAADPAASTPAPLTDEGLESRVSCAVAKMNRIFF